MADSTPGTDKHDAEVGEAAGVLRDSRRIPKPASLSLPLISEYGFQDKKFHVPVLRKPQPNDDSSIPVIPRHPHRESRASSGGDALKC